MKKRIVIMFFVLAQSLSYLFSIDFSKIDEYAIKTPVSQTKNIEMLSNYLTKDQTNDWFKVRAIFRWVAQNIAYDTDSYFSGRYGDLSDKGVLSSKKSVCSGYSNLFESLCKYAGLEVVSISGYGKGYGYKEGQKISGTNHAWNAVKIDNEWKLFDVTWGAGYVNGRNFVRRWENYWFATDPEMFIFSHYPSNEEWQLLEDPISVDDFQKLPNLKGDFFGIGFSVDKVKELLNSPDYKGLVTTYSPKYDTSVVTVIDSPVSKYLKAGVEYNFELIITNSVQAAIINGDWTFIKNDNNKYSIKYKPVKGTLKFNVKYSSTEKNYWGLLEYIVVD